MQSISKETGVFILTVPVLEGWAVEEYYGLVSGTSIYGANFMKDFFARVRDTIGGRARGYENSMNAAVEEALSQMARKAQKLGANAVLSTHVTTGAMSGRMLLANAHGTAVLLRQTPTTD